jgi:apolipoprotein N-acyltransferase
LRGLRRVLARPGLPASILAAAASGLALWLSLPPADLGPLALVALIPVLWAVRGARARRGALLGLVFGLVSFGLLLSWLAPLTGVGYAAVVMAQAGWTALLFAYVAAVWRDERPIRTALAVGAGWAAIEWLRSVFPFGGLTWASLGETQHDNPLLLPLASVIGAHGIALVVAAINALALAAIVRARPTGEWRRWAWPVGVGAAMAVLPVAIPLSRPDGPPVDVAVIQGNVPPDVGARSRIIEDVIVAQNHAGLHRQLAGDAPDLAVWPENAVDRDPTRDPELRQLVTESIRAVGAPALVGAITETDTGGVRNEILLFTAGGDVVDRYAKNVLLPYGEYVPFRRFLQWIPDVLRVPVDMQPGSRPGRFQVGGSTFATLICWENVLPGYVRRTVTDDTGFLVVSTNNSTFLRTPASEQHLVMSEMRAVENGRWVVHGALSGISAIVSPRGEVFQRTGLYEQAIVRADVPTTTGRTVWGVVGGWMPAVFLLGAALGLLAPRRARRRALPPLPADPQVAVVLPTFNERDTIEEVVRRVLAACEGAGFRVRVVVVDDRSPDGTGEIVQRIAATDARVTLIERPAKRGLASAYLEGFELVLQEGHHLVVEMDADLSHRPEELPRLLEAAQEHHLVIGSRYVPGGSVNNWTLLRRLLSRAGNLYVRVLLGLPVADATAGFRTYRADALRELIADPPRSEGYGFQVELAYRAWRRGMSVGEVPITFEDRRFGRSKISRGIVLEAVWQVFRWAVRDRVFRRPHRRLSGATSSHTAPSAGLDAQDHPDADRRARNQTPA